MSIAIVSIPVTDQITARDFYRDVMGFTLLRDEEMEPDTRGSSSNLMTAARPSRSSHGSKGCAPEGSRA
jgi:catechol 2,3-dioxygenase-like lactoylglutathione lyase family enzyme